MELETIKSDVVKIKEEYNIKNNLTGKTIFDRYVIDYAQQGLLNKEVFDGVYKVEEIIGIAKDYQHHDHTSRDSITQKVAYLKENIEFSDIEEVLNSLPKSIYRVKGVIKTTDVANPIVINYSFGDVSYEELDSYSQPSIMIFIGEDIDKDVNMLTSKFNFLNVPLFKVKK
jgi:G3E family GTPase